MRGRDRGTDTARGGNAHRLRAGDSGYKYSGYSDIHRYQSAYIVRCDLVVSADGNGKWFRADRRASDSGVYRAWRFHHIPGCFRASKDGEVHRTADDWKQKFRADRQQHYFRRSRCHAAGDASALDESTTGEPDDTTGKRVNDRCNRDSVNDLLAGCSGGDGRPGHFLSRDKWTKAPGECNDRFAGCHLQRATGADVSDGNDGRNAD